MVYETSYESGRKPFVPDLSRGHWAAPGDFIYACLGLAFKLDVCFVSWFFVFSMGFLTVVPYLICLALYVVPIMVIQSFMGQFSSSGFISVFRISPLFKGMGYVSLALNMVIIVYYSLFAIIPLLYFFHSFRPTLPWSCEGFEKWAHLVQEDESNNLCYINHTDWNNITDEYNSTEVSYMNYHVTSVLFLKSLFDDFLFYGRDDSEISISWQLVMCSLFIWSIIAGVLYKFSNTAKLGEILRYCIWTTLVLLVICIARFTFLPGAKEGLIQYFEPKPRDIEFGILSVPIYAMAALGAGWGSIVSLSSFNQFQTNIMRSSWIIGIGQMIIFMAFGLITHLVESHFSAITDDNYFSYVEYHWVMFLSSASAIANMSLPNLWSILYYGMLSLAAFVVILTQLYSILISIFDEFENLRQRKMEVTLGLVACMALCSLYFCTNHGVMHFSALSIDSLFNQTVLNLLLLLVVLWIYGRERFQRDIEFMLNQRFQTWKVNMLRFASPICLLITLCITFFCAIYEHFISAIAISIFAILFIVLPWFFIPGYSIFIMFQTTGSFLMRFKRCSRPTDWYPVQLEDRQRYEEAMGNVDITHQLQEVGDEVL